MILSPLLMTFYDTKNFRIKYSRTSTASPRFVINLVFKIYSVFFTFTKFSLVDRQWATSWKFRGASWFDEQSLKLSSSNEDNDEYSSFTIYYYFNNWKWALIVFIFVPVTFMTKTWYFCVKRNKFLIVTTAIIAHFSLMLSMTNHFSSCINNYFRSFDQMKDMHIIIIQWKQLKFP